MKKTILFLMAVIMAGTLSACASETASYNGKVCPKGSDSKIACNRNPMKSPGN